MIIINNKLLDKNCNRSKKKSKIFFGKNIKNNKMYYKP